MTAQTQDYREELAKRREVQRTSYATFRTCAAKLMRAGAVRFNSEEHRYFSAGHGRHILATQKFLKLQRNIEKQSALLLELEHAIDCEEQKILENEAAKFNSTLGDNPGGKWVVVGREVQFHKNQTPIV